MCWLPGASLPPPLAGTLLQVGPGGAAAAPQDRLWLGLSPGDELAAPLFQMAGWLSTHTPSPWLVGLEGWGHTPRHGPHSHVSPPAHMGPPRGGHGARSFLVRRLPSQALGSPPLLSLL